MRPRLPLCLLPFVGAVALFSLASVSQSATIVVENHNITDPDSNLVAGTIQPFDINGWGWERDPRYVTNKNTFLTDTTLNFRTRTLDGLIIPHPGGATDLHYLHAVTFKAGNLPNYNTQYNGIGITGGKTLTFTTSWGASLPHHGHYWVSMMATNVGGEASTKAGEGNVVFDLAQTNEFFVFSGTGASNLISLGRYMPGFGADFPVLVETVGLPVGWTELPATDPALSWTRTPYTTANFIIQGNVDVKSGIVVYADHGGTFRVGREELVGQRGQSTLTVSNMAGLVFTAGDKADFYSNVLVDRATLYFSNSVNEGSINSGNTVQARFYSGLTVKNLGVVGIDSNGAILGSQGISNTDVNVVEGGRLRFYGRDFIVNSTTNVNGFAKESGELSFLSSSLKVESVSLGGRFLEDVNVSYYGSIWLDGRGITLEKNLNISEQGILRLGSFGAQGNDVTIKGVLNLGNRARVEVDTRNTTTIRGSDKKVTGFNFQQDGYFSIMGYNQKAYAGSLSEDGNTSIAFTTNGGTVDISAPLTSGVEQPVPFLNGAGEMVPVYIEDAQGNLVINPAWQADPHYRTDEADKWGRYEIAGVIQGAGNVGLFLNTNMQRLVLSGTNTYTGDTRLFIGLMEVTSENRIASTGQIVSGSLGAGNSNLIFANKHDSTNGSAELLETSYPMLALSTTFNGTLATETKDFYKNMVIGSHSGDAYAYVVAGDHTMLVDPVTVEWEPFRPAVAGTVQFAADVRLHGSISEGNGAKGHFVKEGTGNVTLVGTGNQYYQASYTGNTIVRNGSLTLENKDGFASLNPNSVILLDDGMTSSRRPSLVLGADTGRQVDEYGNYIENVRNADGSVTTYFEDQLGRALVLDSTSSYYILLGDEEEKMVAKKTEFNGVAMPILLDAQGFEVPKPYKRDFANNIAFRQGGSINVSSWLNGTLTGDIYDSGEIVPNRDFTLNLGNADNTLTLAGNVGIDGILRVTGGKELIVTGNILGAKTYVILGDSTSMVFDPQKVDASKVSYFAGTISGGLNLIKRGVNELVLLSDLAHVRDENNKDMPSYKGGTIVENGTLRLAGEGALSADAYLEIQSAAEVAGVSRARAGKLALSNTIQKVTELRGTGELATEAGELIITKGNTADIVSGNMTYFGGFITGSGILNVKVGTGGIFQLGEIPSSTKAPAHTSSFTGYYRLASGTTLVNSTDVLAHGANLTLEEGAVLQIANNTEQSINNLYSAKWEESVLKRENGVEITSSVGFDLTQGGTIILGSASKLNVGAGNGTGGVYAGYIHQAATGAGASFVKTGTGTFTLKGMFNADGSRVADQFTYRGETVVNKGTLILDGVDLRQAEEPVRVQGFETPANLGYPVPSGATLVAGLTTHDVYLNKLVMKGGILDTVVGNEEKHLYIKEATFEDATLRIAAKLIDNKPSYSALKIDGLVNLEGNNNSIELKLAPGNWAYGHTLDLFEASASSSLNAINVIDNYILLSLNRNTAVGDNVVRINVTRDTAVSFASVAQTGAQAGVAKALDVIDLDYRTDNNIRGMMYSSMGAVMNNLYVAQDVNTLRTQMQSLSGYGNVVVATVQLMDLAKHQDTIRNRASLLGSGYTSGTIQTTEDKYHGWALGLADSSSVSASNNIPKFDKDTWGAIVGFDTDVSAELSLGGAFTYMSSDIKIDGGNKATNDSYYLDAYGRYRQNEWSFTSVLSFGMTSADINRDVKVGDFAGHAKGSTNGYQLALHTEAAYEIALDSNWMIQPLANLTLGYHSTGSYDEHGIDNAGLSVDAVNQGIVRLGAGARSRYSFGNDEYNQRSMVEMRALIVQDLTEVSPSVTQGFMAAPGQKWSVDGTSVGKTAFQVGAGVNYYIDYNVSVFADVNAEFRTNADSVGGNIGVRVMF